MHYFGVQYFKMLKADQYYPHLHVLTDVLFGVSFTVRNQCLFLARDCALDATCVLCMACFVKSIHKDHNYRVITKIHL
jgi:hypothetical protein